MAATGTPTPNIGLRIPQGTDPASVADINYNSTVIDQKVGPVGNTSIQEQINSAEEAMAYVVNGNDAPSGGIPSGKYVYVKNNTNGIATGMYITTAAISSGATVQASSLSACSEGAVNSLNSNITSINGNVTTLLNRTQVFTDSSFAEAEANMPNDSMCLLRAWPHKDDFPGSGNGNWSGVVFKGEGNRWIRFCSNDSHLWVKVGNASNSWNQIF